MKTPRLLILPMVAMSWLLSVPAAIASEPNIRAAVRASIPYLQREGVDWIEKRGCVSCHQVPYMLWSLSAASQHGFEVDAKQLHQWQDWSTQAVHFVKPAQKEDVDVAKTLAANIDTMAALMLAIDGNADETWRTTFADALIENQQEDASWKACGQLPAQKRSSKETHRVTALWTLLALTKQAKEPRDFESALAFADQGAEAESTEWWVARLLLAVELGDDQADKYRQQLLDRQREDGGWGWLSKETSDALATGMALYAIAATGDGSDDGPSIDRAVAFLTSTQKENGSWDVPGTKKSTRKKPTPTSSYWGTAWAVIGMLESGR